MQKNFLAITLLCALSMSGFVRAMDKTKTPVVEDLTQTIQPSDSDISNHVVHYEVAVGTQSLKHQDPIKDVIGNLMTKKSEVDNRINNHEGRIKVLEAAKGVKTIEPKRTWSGFGRFAYDTAIAGSGLAWGMKFGNFAAPAWKAATFFGGNVANALGGVSPFGATFIGGGLKSAAVFGGNVATKAVALTPYSGCIAFSLFAAKIVWDCKNMGWKKNDFNNAKSSYQALLNQQKQDHIEGTSLTVNQDDAVFIAKYNATDRGVYGYILKKAFMNNLSALAKPILNIGSAAATVVLLGMLAQQK